MKQQDMEKQIKQQKKQENPKRPPKTGKNDSAKKSAGKSGDTDMYAKKTRNKETNIITFIFVGLFAMLTGYLVYFNVFVGPEVINNPYNKRIDALEEKIIRGNILSSNGSILATTAVDGEGNETRQYPFGNKFSHVVGMSTHGKTGIEGMSNFYLLSGSNNIFKQLYSDVSGEKLKGNNIITTLDVALQEAAYDALGNNKGAVVVMDPSTGKVLAMVSKPDYDPNDAAQLWDTWISYDSKDSVLLNRATQGLYPPGSTFKILTALENIRQWNDYDTWEYKCRGSISEGNVTIRCFDETVHGNEDLTKAFAYSCNSAFVSIGLRLDKVKFKTTCEDFLFNNTLPLSIEYSQSSFRLNEESSVSETMQTSIGQGKTQITPIHNLLIAAAVANKGVMMKPYLVDKIVSADLDTVEIYSPEAFKTVMTVDEANMMTEYMKQVSKIGTGHSFKNASYDAAGKTGSAQYDESENYHSWYVGFAPADEPQIAISVVLEGGYTGVSSAQVVAKKVMDAYFTK